MKLNTLEINLDDLPLIVELKINGILKEYVLKPNKDKTGVFLNKKESY